MKAFFGTFVNKVDAKGRISVPAPFRAVIQGRGLMSVALHPSLFDACLEGAGFDRFENLLSGFKDSFVPAARDEAAELIMEELRELPLDGSARRIHRQGEFERPSGFCRPRLEVPNLGTHRFCRRKKSQTATRRHH